MLPSFSVAIGNALQEELFNDDGKLAAAGRDARVVQPLQGRKGAEVGVVHEEVEAGLASKSSYIPGVGTQYA